MGCDQMVRKAYKVVVSDMEMVLKEHGCLSKDGAGDGLEDNRVELIHGGDDSFYEQVGSERSSSSDQQQHEFKPSSPRVITGEFIIKNSMQDQLESARAEIGKIREENERLKIVLAKIMKDYQSLQVQLHHIMQQETESGSPHDQADHSFEEQELVSLTLGTNPTQRPKKEEAATDEASIEGEDDHGGKLFKHGLILGFEKTDNDQIETPKNQSPRKSLEEGKDEDIKEPWQPSEVEKTLRNGEEVAVHEQPPLKKARVSVRARCDAHTMNDGCQWRKYGQKIAKGNPCPRAYYRCTVAPGCPVRKQIQRCAEDMSFLITTYEGNHSHPLPSSATAMASMTLAAACMLTSASTSGHIVGPSSATTTTFSGLHNLNLDLSNSSRSSPFYLSNHSVTPSPTCPTITLDLTSHPSTTSQLNRLPTRFPSSTSFNFTSNGNNYLSYTNSKNGSFTLGAIQPQDQLYPSYLQKNPNNNPTQAALTSDTIAAATKVLTSDPNFKSALADAITSVVSNGRREANSANILKWGEQLQSLPSFTPSHVINSCSPSFLSRSSSTTPNAQSGNFAFLPPPLQLSLAATDASASPMDNGEHTS